MEPAFTADQLFAMTRARERETRQSRLILLTLLIVLAAAFAYNTLTVGQLWARLSQGWMCAWACLLLWRFRRTPRSRSATESCATFLQREFENKRTGLLEIRRYMFLLIPPIAISWWAGGGRAIRLQRLAQMRIDPSSRLYDFANGPGPVILTAILLVIVWLAFGLAANTAAREIEELRRRVLG